jgi:hypothetical protein
MKTDVNVKKIISTTSASHSEAAVGLYMPAAIKCGFLLRHTGLGRIATDFLTIRLGSATLRNIIG